MAYSKPAKKYQDELKQLKDYVRISHEASDSNNRRFNHFKKFVYQSTLNSSDRAALKLREMPQLEFNICEAVVSKFLGEFAKYEPSIMVSASDEGENSAKMAEFVEGHLRAIFYESAQDNTQYNTMKDCLFGFGLNKVYEDWSSPMSLDRVVKWDYIQDPTMTGYDPLAKKGDKSDGRWFFCLYPKTEEDLIEMGVDTSKITFSRNVEGFSWSYTTSRQERVGLVCEFYKQVRKKVKIVKLSTGKTILQDDYNKLLEDWDQAIIEKRTIAQAPTIVDYKMDYVVSISRYVFVESEVLEYRMTDLEKFPYINFDGNSELVKDSSNNVGLMTRPYVYNLIGTQRMKDAAGNMIVNEVENQVMHKFKIAKESIIPEYSDSLSTYQIPNMIVYAAYDEQDPNKPLPPPMEVSRVPMPPEIFQIFMATDQVAQSIMGVYDGMNKMQNNQLSGRAMEIGQMQTDTTSMPYIVRYLQGLQSVAISIVQLLPKVIKNERTLKVIDKEGNSKMVKVNGKDGLKLDYNPNELEVRVEPGVSFATQKAMALNQLMALAQANQGVAAFVAAKGLKVIFDNLDIRGVDALKIQAQQWMEEQEQQQKQAQAIQQQQMQMQMAMAQKQMSQPNPDDMKNQIAMAKLQSDTQQNQIDNHLRAMDMGLQAQELQDKRFETLSAAQQSHEENLVELAKTQTERLRTGIDLAIQHSDSQHSQKMDHFDMAHKAATLVQNQGQHEDQMSAAKSNNQDSTE